MCTAAFIRFIAQVSLKAIRGEVAIYYGSTLGEYNEQNEINKISRAATLRVGDKISTLQVATGAGAMVGHLSAMLFVVDLYIHLSRAIRGRWIKKYQKNAIMFAYMNKKQYLCAKL